MGREYIFLSEIKTGVFEQVGCSIRASDIAEAKRKLKRTYSSEISYFRKKGHVLIMPSKSLKCAFRTTKY